MREADRDGNMWVSRTSVYAQPGVCVCVCVCVSSARIKE